MNERDWVIVGAAGLALYVVYRYLNPPPLTTQQAANAITNAGGNVRTTQLGTFYDIPGGIIKLDAEPQAWNPAQRILIGLDRAIPGDFLTRLALT